MLTHHSCARPPLAAACCRPWPLAAPLTLDQALDLAVQRSEAARAGARRRPERRPKRLGPPASCPTRCCASASTTCRSPGPTASARRATSMTMKRIGIGQEWLSARQARRARGAPPRPWPAARPCRCRSLPAETRLQTALAYLDAYYAGEALKLTTLTEHHAARGVGSRARAAWRPRPAAARKCWR